MPADLVGRAAMYGGFTGLPPLGWIVLNINFRPQLAEANGNFKILQDSPSCITEVKRLQLLIAFCFGAFFEGAAGFGTALAVTARSPIGPGFLPLVSPSCGYELANLGACRALGRACVEAGNGLSLGAQHSHAWRHGAHGQRRISVVIGPLPKIAPQKHWVPALWQGGMRCRRRPM